MKPIDLRVREETLALAQALADQRGLDRAALLREALDVGLQILAASGPPAENGTGETYGTLAGLRLAQWLRPRIAPVLDFLSRYGATPLIAALTVPSTLATHPPPQETSRRNSPFSMDGAVGGTLDAFGVEALGDA